MSRKNTDPSLSDDSVGGSGRPTVRDRLKGLLVLEAIALGIALVAPVTPSRTGSTWSPAELLTAEPTYLLDVLVSFVVVNLMFAVLAMLVWIVTKVSGSE
jgi:hypothetical protein